MSLTVPRRYFFLWIIHVISVLCLLCCRVRLFIDDLWSPAGKGLTSWLSFVMFNCEFVTFLLVSWVRCGSWLHRFLIFALFLTHPFDEAELLYFNCLVLWLLVLCGSSSQCCGLVYSVHATVEFPGNTHLLFHRGWSVCRGIFHSLRSWHTLSQTGRPLAHTNLSPFARCTLGLKRNSPGIFIKIY